MKIDKRIWKTAVLAAVITIVGSMFIMRLDDWSKGLNSGFIAYGQTGSGSGGSTGTSGCSSTAGSTGTTSSACVTKVVPHIVFGGKYQTIIQVINTSTSTVNVNANFFTQSGAVSAATYTTTLNGTPGTFNKGVMPAQSIPINAALLIGVTSDSPDILINWGTITATATVTVATVFELREVPAVAQGGVATDPGILDSRVGVASSAADMKQFVIPRFRSLKLGSAPLFLDVGFAIANTGSTATIVTATLYDASGNKVATAAIPLNAMSQAAKFASDLFGAALKDDPTGTAYQSIVFTADKSQVAAMALVIEGGNLASFPVDRIQ